MLTRTDRTHTAVSDQKKPKMSPTTPPPPGLLAAAWVALGAGGPILLGLRLAAPAEGRRRLLALPAPEPPCLLPLLTSASPL